MKEYDQLDKINMASLSREFTYDSSYGYQLDRSEESGIGIRAVVKGKVGHAFANREDDVEKAIKEAVKFTKYSNISFELKKFNKYKHPTGIYSSALLKMNDKDFLEQIKQVLDIVNKQGCRALTIMSSAGNNSVNYSNSEGTNISEKSTGFNIGWDLDYKENTCSYGVSSTSFVKDVSKEVEMTCELTKLRSKKVDLKTGVMPVVFHHNVLPDILFYSLIPSISARMIQQGKSKLANKIGEKILSNKLTITDNGLLAKGIGSSSFDSEGVPSQKTKIIEKGVLKNYLYDLARAKVDNVASTGNGFRSYFSAADIAPSNLVIAKGTKDLVREIDNGILLYNALNTHSIDSVSGDFSIGASPALIIKKGEIIGSAKGILLSGNVYEVLEKIKDVGKDQHYGSTGAFGGSAVLAPSILSECLVIGE